MDGKHRSPSLALIFASVPVQALLMAGVAAAALNSGSTSQMQYSVQVGPPGWVKPDHGCFGDGGSPVPDKDPAGGDSVVPGNLACPAWAYPGPAPDGTQWQWVNQP
jgi:hypothetical protein